MKTGKIAGGRVVRVNFVNSALNGFSAMVMVATFSNAVNKVL